MHHSATFHPAADAALDRLRAFAAAGLTLLALALVAAPSAGAAGCSNEAFRAQSPQLADCRAYEMVSPVDMNGNGIEQAFAIGADGNGVVYGTLNAFGDAQSSIAAKWVARRGAGGWSQASLNPLAGGRVPSAYDEPVVMAAAGDLSQILIGSRYPFDPFDQAPYVNFVKPGNGDVYRVHPGGASEWVSHGSLLPDPTGLDRALGGASDDLSRVFFETKEPLTSATSASTAVNLYESNRGALRSVNVDAGGSLIPGGAGIGRGQGAGAAFYPGEFSGGNVFQGHPVDASAVSADGGVVFFTAPLEPTTTQPQLYASVGGATVLASRCRAGACAGEPAPNGALFVVAPEDGSAAILYSPDQLTAGAPAGGGIYGFDVASGGLAFLTAVGIGDASNHGGVLAASPDGSHLYLCENGEGVSLYQPGTGTLTNIAAVACDAGSAERDAEPSAFRVGTELPGPTSLKQGEPHVTPAAGYLFATTEGEKIDGYESGGHSQVYLYEPGWPAPRCISCRRDGGPAAGDALLNEEAVARGSSGFTPTPVSSGIAVRNLTADGSRAFFVSTDSLVPADVNGSQDVYEWERLGSADCSAASATFSAGAGGCVSLVSSGRDPRGSVLEGVSASGDDVFFSSYESLVPGNTGTELQLYDARVGGGLAAQHQGPPAPCEGSGCRGAASAPGQATPAGSAGYAGKGNVRGRCEELGRRSRKLARRAKQLHRRARALRRSAPVRSRHLHRRARATSKKARTLAAKSKRCASGGQGAGR